jgi:hypothetical protein
VNAWRKTKSQPIEKEKMRMINMLTQSTTLPRLSKAKGFILASLIVGALAVPFLMSPQRAQAQNEHQERSRDPIGAWIVQIVLDPNTVPPGTPLNFMGLYTFSEGGGYVQSTTGPGGGGPPVYGNWVRTRENRVAATGLRFGFDAAHHFTGINKIRESLTFNEQGELTGSFQIDIFLPDGTLLPIHPAGTYQGTRVAIEPLQ